MSLKSIPRNRMMGYAEDGFGFILSGFAAVAASGNNSFSLVILITLASICKAIPSLIQKGKKKAERLEDWLLLGSASVGLVSYLSIHNLDLTILVVSIGIIAKTVLSLIDSSNNHKEKFEDVLSVVVVTVGVIYYFTQSDPTPNVGLLLPAASLVTKTVPSLMIGGLRPVQVGTGAGIGLFALYAVLAALVPQLMLVAGTGCDGTETHFRVPLTVGFQLLGGPDDITYKDKRWHFLGTGGPTTDSALLVQSFHYDNETYYKFPPNGTYYDVWVDVGHVGPHGFNVEKSSKHCLIQISPQPPRKDLHFLGNYPDQWQGYIVQGASVGFDISLQQNTPVTWVWNDNDPSDAKNELNTDDINPGHKYNNAHQYTVKLIAGQDQWYFPVLVISPLSFTGMIEVSNNNGLQLFKSNDTLNLSFTPQSNPSITYLQLPGGNSEKKYSWVIGNGTAPFCTSSSKISHKFTSSGNFLVSVAVMDSSCITPLSVASTIVTVLDPPSITKINKTANSYGGQQVTISGEGFPPEDMVKVTIDNDVLSTEVVANSLGHFMTDPPFSISGLPSLPKHTVVAESVDIYDIKVNRTFTIP